MGQRQGPVVRTNPVTEGENVEKGVAQKGTHVGIQIQPPDDIVVRSYATQPVNST